MIWLSRKWEKYISPMKKRFASELDSGTNPQFTWMDGIGMNTEGTKQMYGLFVKVFFFIQSQNHFLKPSFCKLEQARQNAKAAIDLSMVYAYFEIGKLIVEEEQSGGQRAAYGKYVIPELSKYLTANLGRGFSVTNLKQMRKFYQVYAGDQIGQTLSDQFSNLLAVSTGRNLEQPHNRGWLVARSRFRLLSWHTDSNCWYIAGAR